MEQLVESLLQGACQAIIDTRNFKLPHLPDASLFCGKKSLFLNASHGKIWMSEQFFRQLLSEIRVFLKKELSSILDPTFMKNMMPCLLSMKIFCQVWSRKKYQQKWQKFARSKTVLEEKVCY